MYHICLAEGWMLDTAASPQAYALWGPARSTAIQTVCWENFSVAGKLANASSILLGTGKDLRTHEVM